MYLTYIKLFKNNNVSLLYIDEAKQKNEYNLNSTSIENKPSHSIYKGSTGVDDIKTERLDLGFPDEDEAIQLGLIVPNFSSNNNTNSSGSGEPKHPITTENKIKNNENQLDSSEVSVYSLKNYTQITESTPDKTSPHSAVSYTHLTLPTKA